MFPLVLTLETKLRNPGPCVSGGVCGDTEDAGGQVHLDEGRGATRSLQLSELA